MSESTYPYTVEQFAEAYRATGLRVNGRKTLNQETHCGCPQGAMALHLDKGGPEPFTGTFTWAVKTLGISERQFRAFATAFDYGGIESTSDITAQRDAFNRGLECRKRFLEPEGVAR